MRILGIDPGAHANGRGMTGIGIIEGPIKGNPPYSLVRIDQVNEEAFFSVMKGLILDQCEGQIDQVVIEDFVARPDASRFEYVSMPVIEQIGEVRALCTLAGVPFFKSSPSNKPAAYGWAFNGNPKYTRGKPNMHMFDAVAHAVHYMLKGATNGFPMGTRNPSYSFYPRIQSRSFSSKR